MSFWQIARCRGWSRQALSALVKEWNDPEIDVRLAAVVPAAFAACPAPTHDVKCRPALAAVPAKPAVPPACLQFNGQGVGGEYETRLRQSKFCFAPYG